MTMKNSVPSGVPTTSGGDRENKGNVSSKTVPSGPEEEGTYNRFSCFAVHSKMAQSTNAESKPMEGLYTDTDPDARSEIITDVTIRMPGKAGTMMMEVKVDPGAQPSCIPLHKFKTLFPYCCDMSQNDTIGKIELNPSFVLSSDNTNYKNDIQLFHQLFDELSVYRDYH